MILMSCWILTLQWTPIAFSTCIFQCAHCQKCAVPDTELCHLAFWFALSDTFLTEMPDSAELWLAGVVLVVAQY